MTNICKMSSITKVEVIFLETVITLSSHCCCAFNRHCLCLKCMGLLTLNHLFKEEVSTPSVQFIHEEDLQGPSSSGYK